MEPRYIVKRRISVEVGSVTNGMRKSTSSPPGFDIYDTHEKSRLQQAYTLQVDAETECARLNALEQE